MRATPDFDFQLGEAAEMIRDSVGRFADEQIAPLADKIDREDYFPRAELWQQMGELGLHGLTVDEEDGGLGLGCMELCNFFLYSLSNSISGCGMLKEPLK